MRRPVRVSRETVLLLHEQLLAEFGGSSGVRDQGLLDSALARPENLLAYGEPTVHDLAAGYAFGLVKNHPFIDGNKRTGFTVAVLFLELNRHRFNAPEADAVVQTLGLAAGALTESQYADWLKRSAIRLKGQSLVITPHRHATDQEFERASKRVFATRKRLLRRLAK